MLLGQSGAKLVDSRPQAGDDIEETNLLHCWSQTSPCPVCGCESRLLISPETDSDQAVEVVGCELCEVVVRGIVGEIDAGPV